MFRERPDAPAPQAPARAGDLIGRSGVTAEVLGLLEPGRVLTLTGIGGAGKTRIARRVMADSTDRFPAGVWVVELADLTDVDLLVGVVAEVLNLRSPAGSTGLSALVDFFSDRPGLLVLDNCEHLVEGAADLLDHLLGASPGLTVLATSRLPLGISQETQYQVLPLTAPAPETSVDLATSTRYDAIALYVQRAATAMATFELTAANVASVGALVSRLDGVPLAIELAAARVRVLSPEVLVTRLADRFGILESDRRNVPARQRSLSASVGWSYDLCGPDEQTLWNRLSVFAGGFELEAVEQVCVCEAISATQILDLVSHLVDMSVVLRVGETGSRFRMLETIRQYGAERLEDSGEQALWRDKHLRWYADLVERLEREWSGPDQLHWMDTLHAELPNLRAALDHALKDPSAAPTALAMCHRLEPFWICAGLLGEARRWIERAVALTSGEEATKVKALRLCAWFGSLQMDLDYARARVEEAARLLEDLEPDDLTRAHHLFAGGVVASWEQDLESGVALLQEAEAAFRRVDNLSGTIEALLNTGIAHVFAADYDSAGAVHLACLNITDAIGETFVGAYSLWSLGLCALMVGDVASAAALEEDALARSSSLGDQLAMALELETLAWIAAVREDGERAAVLLGGAGSIWRRISMPVARTPYICDLHTVGEAQARALIDDAAFDRHHGRGLAMALPSVVEYALGSGQTDEGRTGTAGKLSRRETEVAALVADGLSNRDIAERLFLSERTVEGHVQHILRKLDVRSRTRIATWFQAQ